MASTFSQPGRLWGSLVANLNSFYVSPKSYHDEAVVM